MILAGRGAAGENGDVLLLGVGYQLGIKAGSHDELAARGDDLVDLLGVGHGARADDHLRAGFLHKFDGDVGAGRAEGDLGHTDAARAQGFAQGGRVSLRMVELDDRHNADLGNGGIHCIHDCTLLKV